MSRTIVPEDLGPEPEPLAPGPLPGEGPAATATGDGPAGNSEAATGDGATGDGRASAPARDEGVSGEGATGDAAMSDAAMSDAAIAASAGSTPPAAATGAPEMSGAVPAGAAAAREDGPGSTPPDVTAPAKGRVGRLLLGCAVLIALLALLCCCGGAVVTRLAPGWVVSTLLEDQPLPGPRAKPDLATAARAKAAACGAFAAGQAATLTPAELSALAVGDGTTDIEVLNVSASGDRAALDLSIANAEEPPRYLNVHTRGAFRMEKGWFTDLKLDEAVLSGHDASSLLAGQQLATSANQSLANERADEAGESVAALLDSIDLLMVQDGAFTVKLAPTGAAKTLLCDSAGLQGLIPPVPVPEGAADQMGAQ